MTRRRRLLLVWMLASAAILGTAAWLAYRQIVREAAPVIPGDRAVEGLTDELQRHLPEDAPRVPFRDAAEDSGLRFTCFPATRSRVLPEDMGAGAALFDADQDGDLDLFAVGMEPLDAGKRRGGAPAGHGFFRNRGDGTFEDASEVAGVRTPVHGLGVAAGDMDGDGDLDVYVTCYGRNQLFRNRGDGTFEDVAEAAGVAGGSFSAGAAFADFDLDGDLDLYVTGYVAYSDDPELRGRTSSQYGRQIPFSINPSAYSPAGSRLFENLGDGTFRDVTEELGVGNARGKGLGVVFTDLTGDGLPDIYVANDVSDNVYYWNRGNRKFRDISHWSGTADYRGAMGLGVGDFDRDLDLDIFVTHWVAQENALYRNITDEAEGGKPGEGMAPAAAGGDDLGGAALYSDEADRYGLGAIALDYVGWGTSFLDFDLDGRLDILVVNGHTLEVDGRVEELEPQRMLLFWNGGDRGFFEVGPVSGDVFARKIRGRGAAFGDVDGDGDEDAYVVVHGGPGLLLRNDQATGRHWLTVRPRARSGNRFAIGAKVLVTTEEGTAVRVIGAQTSYLSTNTFDAHFGLGAAAAARRVEVIFPGGGRRVLENVPADRVLIVEAEGGDAPR